MVFAQSVIGGAQLTPAAGKKLYVSQASAANVVGGVSFHWSHEPDKKFCDIPSDGEVGITGLPNDHPSGASLVCVCGSADITVFYEQV